MAALPFIAAGASLLGGVVSGLSENAAAQSEAKQLEAKGKEEYAAAQREAIAKTKEGDLASSRLQALAAASGGGADTPTVVNLMSGILSDAKYNAATVRYGGEQRRAGLFDAASNRRKSGQASLLGSVLGGLGSAASVKFG